MSQSPRPRQPNEHTQQFHNSAISTRRRGAHAAKLIAPMLARFMATDRAFAKARRNIVPKS